MRTIPYEELDKHFTAPPHLNQRPFYNYKRFPRKLKKRLKKTEAYHICWNDLNTTMWYLMDRNYRIFLIKKLAEIYGADYKAGSTRGE